ncbi:TVP38/TMEM64 family protein [Streptomyces werraensis]|uniref:TVP38/TMEM64 family protein n=1 Tax=Streptomyces werraensis TaxID=68284 RepID=UPI0033B0D1BA
MRIHPLARLALLVALLAAAASSLLLWSPRQVLYQGFAPGSPEIWAAPAFVVVFALATLAFFPKPVLNVAAGVLFGVEGLVLAAAGTTLGAVLAFILGRSLGREALQPLLKKKILAALDRSLTDQGFRSVLLLRIVPGIPFQAVNFAAAFSGIRLWSFTAATAVGVLPGTAAYVIAGASASSPTSPAFLISTAVMIAMTALTLVSLRRARRTRISQNAVKPVWPSPGAGS